VAEHYFHGGWYPRGGSGEIAKAFLAQIEGAGGACWINCAAEQILVERNRAMGVHALLRRGSHQEAWEIRAPLVISDAGVEATYQRLLGTPQLAPPTQKVGASAVTLYLGLKRSPAEMGFRGENHWLFDSINPEETYAARAEVGRGRSASGYLSFPSLKDPAASHHSAQVITLVDDALFAPWKHLPWMHRGPEYEALKERVAGELLDLVERYHPGFRELVAYRELSTPLSVEHFTGHTQGRIYGAPATIERLRDHRYGVRTPVRGLFLAGADAASLGIVGALLGGVFAAGASLGPLGVPRIFAAASRRAGTAAAPRLLPAQS
jgi:phytoene dehydrogenase-like protein